MFAPETLTARTWRRLIDINKTHRVLVWWPLLAVLLVLVCAAFFDQPVSDALRQWPAHERAFFIWFTGFGKSDWILVPALLGMIVGWGAGFVPLTYSWRWAMRGTMMLSAFVFATVAIPGLVTVVLKRIFGRARPYVEDTNPLHFEPFDILTYQMHSFPSGHSTTAMAFAVVLVTLTSGRWRKTILGLGLLIGVSRIVVGDHYLSDVLAGVVIGTVVAFMVRDYFATRRWGMKPTSGTRVNFRVFSAFRPLWRWLRAGHVPKLVK